MLKFYGQRVVGHNTYIAFNSHWYFKKVVSISDKHVYYKYLENDLFIGTNKIDILSLKEITPCSKNVDTVDFQDLSFLEIEMYKIHITIEKYIIDNDLNFYTPWWHNDKLSKEIEERIKCLNIQ